MLPDPVVADLERVMEIRVHGRGGQGGVTCAKILASVYAQLGKDVQTFGDYAGERSGSPVRAYTRVGDSVVTSRNKVYEPDHLVVLDPSLLKGDVVMGLRPGGSLLLNTPKELESFGDAFGPFTLATVDATEIARRHKIGSRSLVIVNTAIAGAFIKLAGLSLDLLEETYARLGLQNDFTAAQEAYLAVRIRAPIPVAKDAKPPEPAAAPARAEVTPLTEHVESAPTGLKTGSWSSQRPMYTEKLAPCSARCPAGNDVVGFVRKLHTDGEQAAALVLSATNPLPGVCGRICPAPCMGGCNRGGYDGAVNIRGLERWIADHAGVAAPSIEPAGTPRRVAIIGAGPTGLSAAYTVALAGHLATLFDGAPLLGGSLRTIIPEYRLPRDVLDREIDAILALGVEARTGESLEQDRIAALAGEFDAVILATGLGAANGRDVPEVEGLGLDGVAQGGRFLARHVQGLSEGVGREVLVVGSGYTALDCARVALREGARHVTLAFESPEEMLRATPGELEEARDEGVRILSNKRLIGLSGDRRVEAAELIGLDEKGEPTRLEVDQVVLALGRTAAREPLPDGWIQTGERITLPGGRTLFIAGDLRRQAGSVAHAIFEGRRTAAIVLAALGEDVDPIERPDPALAVPLWEISLESFETSEPNRDRLRPAALRVGDRAEVNLGLETAGEAGRCFSCGHCTHCENCLVYCPEGIIRRTPKGYAVNFGYCKGCGLCVEECPRGGMEMKEL